MVEDYKDYKSDKVYKDLMREYFAKEPKDVDGVLNSSVMYWRDYLYRLLFGCFDIDGCPEEWDKGYMFVSLFEYGMFCITDTEMGVLPLRCGIWGHNVFNRPSKVNVANHVLGSFTRTIDKDCALIHLQYNYLGVESLMRRTAVLLAMADSSIAVNLMNSKVAFIGFAESKAEASTMQKIYDMISAGIPAVFVRKQQVNRNDIYYNHVKNNFVAIEIQDVQREIVDQFLTKIGINNANRDKRERMVVPEIESNNMEVEASVEHWLVTVNKELDKANKMFNLNLHFKRKEFKIEVPESNQLDREGDNEKRDNAK